LIAMKYALFTAVPFVGHLNPLMHQAAELQRRGWRVAIAATSEMRGHVEREAPSLPFIDLGPLGDVLIAELRRVERDASVDPNYHRGASLFLPLLGRMFPVMFDGLLATMTADRPDVIVIDLFTWAGYAAAQATGVRSAINNPSLLTAVPLELLPPAPDVPFVLTKQSIHDVKPWQRALHPLLRRLLILAVSLTLGRRIKALWRTRGLTARLPESMQDMPILVNGAFGLEYQRPLPPNVTMVGPMLAEVAAPVPAELAQWVSGGPPVTYINLGTVVCAWPELLEKIVAAVAVSGTRAVWVLKPAQAKLLPSPLPPGLRIVDWLPSTQALLRHPNVRVFVSHCGINSVHESIACGTPIVGIPMLADQRDMAVRVADAGVGLYLDKVTFTAAELRNAVARVLNEASFRDRIPALQRAFVEAGDVRRAADVIEQAA
jgi:UDP:flavonoid glycosyltransferase YjiC (YdhE family)